MSLKILIYRQLKESQDLRRRKKMGKKSESDKNTFIIKIGVDDGFGKSIEKEEINKSRLIRP